MSSLLKSSHKRMAASRGRKQALDDYFLGATEPRDNVFSGEWADDWTPKKLGRDVGYPVNDELRYADTDEATEEMYDLDNLVEVFDDAYVAKFVQINACEHVFKGRGQVRSWGVSDKARCQKCGVHVLSGTRLI